MIRERKAGTQGACILVCSGGRKNLGCKVEFPQENMTSLYPVPSFIFVNLPLSHPLRKEEEGQEDKERLGISEGAVRSGVVLE